MAAAARPTTNQIERVMLVGTDLEVIVSLDQDELTIELRKSNVALHRVIVEQATAPMEDIWLADLFVRDARVRLADVSADIIDFLADRDVAQG